MAWTIVHTDFHRGWGGQIQRVLAVSAELSRRGHRVILCVPAGGRPARLARAEGLEVYGEVRFDKAKRVVSMARDVAALRRLLARVRPDVVHSHGSQDTWAVALANRLPPRAPSIPHLLTRHNTKRVRDSAANRWLLVRGIDRLVVVAPETLERYRPFVRRGELDPGDVPVLPSPLRRDLPELDAVDRGALRAELGLPPDVPLVGTAARLVPDKGIDVLLEAFARAGGALERAHLVLAGDGKSEHELRRRAARDDLAGRVHFLGFREDVGVVLGGLDLAVLPSVDCDASSGMLKEALALGTPAVATDVGAAREILGPGADDRIVPPGDAGALARAIGRALERLDALRRRAGDDARRIRQTYTVARLADALEAVYAETIDRVARRP